MESKTSAQSGQPLISVIIPIYNIMEYLPRCVESVCSQTYTNLEILLVDDGSTDGTGELCDELAGKDDRIRVFHKENGGSSSARNLGIKEAKGEYIGFVDSDDYIDREMYELLLWGISKYGVNVAQIGRNEIDEAGNPLPDICIPPRAPEIVNHEDFLRELLMHRGDCSFCTKLFCRDLLMGRQFPVGALNEDFHFLVKLLPEIGKIVSLPKQAYHVFYRMGSNSRKKDKNQFSRVFADNVDNADMVMEMVKKNYPELKNVAFRFGAFQRIEYLLHIPISQMRKDNEEYRKIVKWMRKNALRSITNYYLTGKNKIYYIMFAMAPKGIRVLHAKIKGL